jgi:hypothetical protein
MKFRQTFTSVIAIGLLGVFTTVASAQQPPAQQPPAQQERQRTEDATITGCLAKGSGSGQYVLTDKAGTKTTVTAGTGVELDKHAANHTVKLTGSKGAEGNFTASKVEHVSATCATQ